MNTTVFFIGGLSTLSTFLKPTQEIIFKSLFGCDVTRLKNYLVNSFQTKLLNDKSTLVFDVSSKNDSEIMIFLENIIPTAKNSFQSNWNSFQKQIVILLPKESKLTSILNTYGLTSYTKETDIEDFLSMRDLVLNK